MSTRPASQGGADTLAGRLPAQLSELHAFARRLVAGAAPPIDPEDVVHLTVERALRYRHSFDAGRDLLPWLKRATFRAFLDERERLRRGAGGSPVPEPADGARAHTEAVADRDEVELLLARLSGVERDVVVRFHQRGQSLRDIAQALGMPEGTVKSHLHRARRRLAAPDGKPTR